MRPASYSTSLIMEERDKRSHLSLSTNMSYLDNPEPWAEGAEEHRGRRLIPHIIDFYSHHEPDRFFAAISTSESVANGFRDVTMKAMAGAVNNMARWLDGTLSMVSKKHRTLAYIGVNDLRYMIVLLAAMKCGWRTVFISPRNPAILNLGLLQQADVNALLYANAMRPTAQDLHKFDPWMACKQVPSLADLLKPTAAPYHFNGSFAELKDRECLILHSSGSTGPPKLVYLTHAVFSCTDNDTRVPVPKGRIAQNTSMFKFDSPSRFYSCFPPYHMSGVQSYLLIPAFYPKATVVMGPAMIPPSGFLVNNIMKQQEIKALLLPPSIIEQWATDPSALEQAEKLDFVICGGGPLAQSVGNKLAEITDVCQTYGSLEMGQIQMLMPQPGEWEYFEINSCEECDMQEVDDGVFEMVLHADKKFIGQRTLAHTFPDIKTWRTKDLFVPHPSKTGLWRFHSRTDDIIVLGNGHKVWPIPMETQLADDPHISGVLMVGNGRPEVLLLVEPRRGLPVDQMSKKEFIDAIWPTIAKANAIAPEYGRIRRSRIILSQPNLGFFRAPKGTISRKPTESLYAEYISGTFIDSTADEESAIDNLEKYWMGEAIIFIGSIIHDISPDITLKESDDFFVANAVDPLTVVELGQRVRLGLLRHMDKERNTIKFWLRIIFENPTIEDLAKAILNTVSCSYNARSKLHQTFGVEEVLVELTRQLPEPNDRRLSAPLSADGIEIVLLVLENA